MGVVCIGSKIEAVCGLNIGNEMDAYMEQMKSGRLHLLCLFSFPHCFANFLHIHFQFRIRLRYIETMKERVCGSS